MSENQKQLWKEDNEFNLKPKTLNAIVVILPHKVKSSMICLEDIEAYTYMSSVQENWFKRTYVITPIIKKHLHIQ
jgi:hypothetical protein